MTTLTIKININEKDYKFQVPPNLLLVNLIRENLDLTGTKIGCGEGDCGACTIIMNGNAVTSCILLAADCDGSKITTIEGIGTEEKPHILQKIFLEEGAVQCGFCTPGMILSAKALLDKNPNPSQEEIEIAMSGNLCRCTGYQKILNAVEICAKEIGGEK